MSKKREIEEMEREVEKKGQGREEHSAAVSGTVWRACARVRTHPYREVEYHRHSEVTPIVLSSL